MTVFRLSVAHFKLVRKLNNKNRSVCLLCHTGHRSRSSLDKKCDMAYVKENDCLLNAIHLRTALDRMPVLHPNGLGWPEENSQYMWEHTYQTHTHMVGRNRWSRQDWVGNQAQEVIASSLTFLFIC